MSIFSEVLSAQQQAVDEPRRVQEFLQQQAMNRQAIQQRASAEQRAMQDQQMSMAQMQRQNQLQDTTRLQGAEGAGAFADFLRSMPQAQSAPPMQGPMPNGQTMQGAAMGPNVSPTQALPRPEMQPLTIQSVAQSIYKQNPKISPEGLIAALERFEPVFNQQSKIELAQIKAQNVGAGKIENLVYQDAISRGLTPTEAAAEAAAYKRAAPEEVGEAALAKGRAKTTTTREADVNKVESALRGFEQDAKLVTNTIDKAIVLAANPIAAGWGSLTSFVPNSPAGKLKGYLDTIKANLGFDKLQTMRDNSPTGAALGPVSDFENRLLQATRGALDPAQADLLSENLKIIKELYPIVLAEKRKAFDQDYGAAKAGSSASPTAPATGVVDYTEYFK